MLSRVEYKKQFGLLSSPQRRPHEMRSISGTKSWKSLCDFTEGSSHLNANLSATDSLANPPPAEIPARLSGRQASAGMTILTTYQRQFYDRPR